MRHKTDKMGLILEKWLHYIQKRKIERIGAKEKGIDIHKLASMAVYISVNSCRKSRNDSLLNGLQARSQTHTLPLRKVDIGTERKQTDNTRTIPLGR